MKTIKEIYRIGHGPSSSHTMAPRFASEQFLERHPEAARFEVTLYGSLAATALAGLARRCRDGIHDVRKFADDLVLEGGLACAASGTHHEELVFHAPKCSKRRR